MSSLNRKNSIYGDAEARRQSVLRAAAELLDEGGYVALTNRAVAKRANISTGLIYQYFVDKQDIFVTLLHESQLDLIEFIRTVPRDEGVEALLTAIIPESTRQWAQLGRLVSTWMNSDGGVEGRGSFRNLLDSTDKQFIELRRALEDAAEAEGLRISDDPALTPFVWSALMGLADNLANNWTHGVEPDALIAYSARAIAGAITT